MTDDTRDPSTVTNAEFMLELAKGGARGSRMWTTAFYGNPDGNPGWGGGPWDAVQREEIVNSYSDRNCYFSTASLRCPPDEKLHRRLEHFDRILAIVVDDPSLDDLNGRPSWVLQTSPGKTQVGIFIDVADPNGADVNKVTALVISLHKKGLIGGDKSGNNAVRYVRLPQGENQKPRESGNFKTQLITWNPGARYSLEDAAAVLGIDLDEVLAEAQSAPASTGAFSGEQDEKLASASASILAGENLHDAINTVAASLIGSGAAPGAVVNMLRGMMSSSQAPRDARWQARYEDIYRSVESAHRKFSQPSVQRGTVDPQTGEVTEVRFFKHVSDLLGTMKPAQFVIDGHMETDSISLLFGPPGTGKSFINIDMACCVATGIPWHGVKVDQGLAIAIIGEGHNGYARRLAAWRATHDPKGLLHSSPLYVSTHSVKLGDPHAALALAAEIDRIVTECGGIEVKLISVDTLARNYGDGDENSAKDMSRFIANVDLYLRGRYGAHVMIVHHSGHDAERARGSSALKGALDQEFKVEGFSGRLTLSCTKMKEAEAPIPRRFKIVKVEVGRDPNDIAIESACLRLDGNPLEVELAKGAGGSITAGTVVKAFLDCGNRHGKTSLGIKLQCSDGTVKKVLRDMATRKLIEKDGRDWMLSAEGIDQAKACGWIDAEAEL